MTTATLPGRPLSISDPDGLEYDSEVMPQFTVAGSLGGRLYKPIYESLTLAALALVPGSGVPPRH